MAINIPRTPISQAATQRRSLLPAQEASRIAKSFKLVVDTAQKISMDYYDKKAQVEAGNFNSNLKTFSEQQEKSFQDSARSIGMSEQEDPMARETQLFELGQTYIDNLKIFVDTETEDMGPLAKKRLAPQMQKALTDLRKDPSGLMLDLTDSMEKGQIDSIKQRAFGDYQEYPIDDLPNQIIKDFNELKAFKDLGRISIEEVKNLEKYTVNNISKAYGAGVTNQTELAVDIMSGQFAELPKTMRTDLDYMLLNNLGNFVSSASADVQNIEVGSFVGVAAGTTTPTAGFIAYKTPDKDASKKRILQFINGLIARGFVAEANKLQISLNTGEAAQANQNQIGHAAASLQNWIMGGIDNPRLTPQMSTAISTLYAKNTQFDLGQQFTSEDLLRFDQAANGLPGFVINQINERIKGHDMEMYEAMYQFMGDGNAFRAADSSSEEFQIESEVLKKINGYRVFRDGSTNAVSAFNAFYSEANPSRGGGGGGASSGGGGASVDTVEFKEEVITLTGTDPDLNPHQGNFALSKAFIDDESKRQAEANPFINPKEKGRIAAKLAVENTKANTQHASNGNIQISGLLDPAKTDPNGTLAWVRDEIIEQLDAASDNLIPGWKQKSVEEKRKYVSGSQLQRTEEGFYQIALNPEHTQEEWPGFIPNFYLDLNYKNSFTFALSEFEKQFGAVEIRNGEVLFGDKEFSDLSADQAGDVVVQMLTGGMGSTYFDPENLFGRVAEKAREGAFEGAASFATEVSEEVEYKGKLLFAYVASRFAEDPEEAYRQMAPQGFQKGALAEDFNFAPTVDRNPESTAPRNQVPPFMMVARYRNMYEEILHSVTQEMQNRGFYEITSGVALHPEFSYAFDRVKNVFLTADAPGKENFLQLLGQKAGLLDDFQTVVVQVANERFQARLKQLIKDNPKVINEFQATPDVQSKFFEIFNTTKAVEDYAKGRVSLATQITDTQTISEIARTSPVIREVSGRIGEMTEDLVETGNTFMQMLTGRGPKGQKFRKALEDSAVGQLADLPVDFATAAKDSFNHVDFGSFWSDAQEVVKDVTVGYGELAGSTIKVLAYDLWKQMINNSPPDSLPAKSDTPFYDSVGDILGGAAEGAWSTVRTLYYDAPKAMGKAFMDSQMGKELKPVLDVAEEVFDAGSEIAGGAAGLAVETLKFPFALIEDLSEATAKQPPVDTKDKMKSLTESAFGRIVIDTSKGFIDLYTEALKVPYMILEQWPKTKYPETITGAVKPVNPFPSLENRFMGQLRMNVDVRMENGVEISIPGQAQINNGMLRVVPDNPRYSNLLNGQNIEIKINPITPIQDALGQSIQFGTDALPSIPTTKFGKPYVPADLESNVEQWKKDNADFNTMPRKDGSYYPSNYDMDVRNVQRFVSSNEPKAIREISKMLYASIDSEDKDFLFVSGLIKKPKGARKGWYGKYYTKESQAMLETYGQNPNAALKTMQTGLSQVMPGNSTVFVLGLTNQQFFSLVEDLHNLYEMESK